MKTKLLICGMAILCFGLTVTAQVNFSANDAGYVSPYNGPFLYGTNGGAYNSWDDKSIADINAGNPSKGVAGAGSKTFRPPLPDNFVTQWGYDIRINEFNYYASLGVQDYTVFLGDPAAAHKDAGYYGGCNKPSAIFRNLYEPIWDNGLNGTPVNENNDFASYVYQIVTRYKTHVKFWEIVNEPDYTGSTNSYATRGEPGNWWENNPAPCELDNLHTPVFYYIRMLRIAYQVIKTVDPGAYVAPGGLGYTSFLDALLRNTDNPTDGSVTADYPLKGGAYFDVLSFHSYPMWALKTWSNSIVNFVYRRHSDAAADEFIRLKNEFDSVLVTRGYNGTTYPKKIFICTETNIPSRPFDWFIGSDEAQRNYLVKTMIESQQHGISQTYVYQTGNTAPYATATAYDVMGLYEDLAGKGPVTNGGAYLQQYTSAGISFKTASDLLRSSRYDPVRTAQMNLPSTIGGGAFTDNTGAHTYVLWARTSVDNSESASAIYSFPGAMNVAPLLNKKKWDFSVTSAVSGITSSNIALTSNPVYLKEDLTVLPLHADSLGNRHPSPAKKFMVSVYPNPASSAAFVQFTLTGPARVRISVYDAAGRWIMDAVASQKFSTGTHSVPVNTAQHLLPGVYYCRFETDAVQVLKKLVVVK